MLSFMRLWTFYREARFSMLSFGQTVLISESSIRRDLLFNDDNGIDCLIVADIYENLPLMGYEGDLTTLTFQKALFSPQWKYLIHTIIHCLSSKSTSWDQFPTNVASTVICLATDRTFNFSKMIFDGMNRNLESKKKFLMYPRSVRGSGLVPIIVLLQVVHTSNRVEGGLNLDELFVLCTNLSNRVLALETSKDAQAAKIIKLKTRIKKLEKKCKPIISHHRAWLRSVSILSMKKKLGKKESVSKQGRKNAKPGPTLDDSAFDDLDADLAHGMDYKEAKEVVNEGRTSSKMRRLTCDKCILSC
ncbi:hypothetical protein Tco_1267597 [Tanacetum coccineum]